MDGQDVIGHLMGIEREAASLLSDAQAEADRRKTAASEESSKKFKEAYEKLVTAFESELKSGMQSVDKTRADLLSSYQTRIEAIPQYPESFNSFLDSVFSGN